MYGQELFQFRNAALPPAIYVPAVKPAEADAHVGDRDELLLGQRLLSGRRHPAFETRLAHGDERNAVRSRIPPGLRRGSAARRALAGGLRRPDRARAWRRSS